MTWNRFNLGLLSNFSFHLIGRKSKWVCLERAESVCTSLSREVKVPNSILCSFVHLEFNSVQFLWQNLLRTCGRMSEKRERSNPTCLFLSLIGMPKHSRISSWTRQKVATTNERQRKTGSCEEVNLKHNKWIEQF